MEELMASVNAGPTEAQAEAGAMAALGRNGVYLSGAALAAGRGLKRP